MIQCRTLTTLEEIEQVQRLEKAIWHMSPIPIHQTLTSIKNGGIMVGLYDEDYLIGFSYSFPGFQNGTIYLCSHMLGILPAYQSQGLGERLKNYQRDIAKQKGYDRMHWTFDPLETRNAYLNLSKLNGICHTYVENCYGEMKDGLNQGLPSDRFELHWHIKSPYVTKRETPNMEQAEAINTIIWTEAGLPKFVLQEEPSLIAQTYTIDVPKDFQALKSADPNLALDWRLQTRTQFQRLFDAGYIAVRLIRYETYSQYVLINHNPLQTGGK